MRQWILTATALLVLSATITGCVSGSGPARPTTVENSVAGDCIQISGAYKGLSNFCRRRSASCPTEQVSRARAIRTESRAVCSNPVNTTVNRDRTRGWLRDLRALTGRAA